MTQQPTIEELERKLKGFAAAMVGRAQLATLPTGGKTKRTATFLPKRKYLSI